MEDDFNWDMLEVPGMGSPYTQPYPVYEQNENWSGQAFPSINILELFNYQIGPKMPITVYEGNFIIDMKLTWMPTITFDNDSQLTLGTDGIGYDLGDGPISTSAYFTDDSFDFGYESSPFVDSWNSSTGMSVSTPHWLKPWGAPTAVHTSIGNGSVTFDSEYSVMFRARPDQVAIAPAIFIAASVIYKAVTTGDTSLPPVPVYP